MKRKFIRINQTIFIFIILIITVLVLNNTSNSIFPIKYGSLVKEYSQKYNIDPYLVFAMIKAESNFNSKAVSPKKSRGLMQISETTGKWGAHVLGISDYSTDSLFDPRTNIAIGCWYYNNLLNEFEGNSEFALAAYNGGSGNVTEWLKTSGVNDFGENYKYIPFEETRNYLKRVANFHSIYKELYLH